MQIVDKLTGLVYEVESEEQIVEAMILVNEQIKSLNKVKDKIRDLIIDKDLNGKEHDGYLVRISATQRMTYDKSLLRQLLDEDVYDILVEPNKKAVDTYLKENLMELGDISTKLRRGMIEVGKPYQTVKLEKVN